MWGFAQVPTGQRDPLPNPPPQGGGNLCALILSPKSLSAERPQFQIACIPGVSKRCQSSQPDSRGLVPAIHAAALQTTLEVRDGFWAWMPGTRPGMTCVGLRKVEYRNRIQLPGQPCHKREGILALYLLAQILDRSASFDRIRPPRFKCYCRQAFRPCIV